MTTNRFKTEYLPKALMVTALLPAIITPLLFAYIRHSTGTSLSLEAREIAIIMLALVWQAAGMAFSLSLALLALAYYGRRPDLDAHKRRFILAGRAFAGVITANLLVGLFVAVKMYFFPAIAETVRADGSYTRTVTHSFALSSGTETLNWLAVVVAVLLIIDLVDETLRLRDESSLTV